MQELNPDSKLSRDLMAIVRSIAEETALATASEIVKAVEREHHIKNDSDVIKRTEKLLYHYMDIKDTASSGPARDFITKMDKCLDNIRCDDEQYSIIKLKYFDNCTLEEIAEELDCDVSTVARRKSRALERLSVMLFADEFIHGIYFK